MDTNAISTITVGKAKELLDEPGNNCVLLDVRTPAEFSSLHATNAINIPLQLLSRDSAESLKGSKILCICQKGTRGAKAAEILSQNGFSDIFNVHGGTDAWEGSGFPVVRGEFSLSLERQVRIAAGLMVALGIIGGYLLTPYLLLVSLFVGCGLVFAGVTNTCGMAMLLARCPWNSK